MKKIISMITCLIILTCMLVVPEPIEVHAEDDVDSIEYSYYMNVLTCDSYNSSMDLGRGHDAYGNFSLIDKQLCLYKVNFTNSVYLYTYVFNDEGIIHHEQSQFFGNVFSYFSSCTGSFKYLEYYYHKETETYSLYKLKGEYAHFNCELVWKNPTIEEFGYIHTNIPIFESQEQALKYINGEIDEKSAINYESDICDILYDLEAPKNLKIKDVQNTGPEGYFNITWEQTDPDYVNWQTEIYNYIDFRYRNSVLIFSWADWKYVEDYYAGQSIVETYKLSYKHRHRDNLDDGDLHDRMSEDYPTDYGGIYKIGDEKLYIRNFYYDGTYKHYSNWIVLEFDSEEDAWMNPEMNSTVVEKEGSELDVDDNGVPIQPDSNVVQDSEYTGGVNENYERVDGTDLISWIKNGFGLGGDNGVLGMMGESFSFIPGEIWAVFAAGISMMVVVAVFKFIRG